jgi:hypothetical protein
MFLHFPPSLFAHCALAQRKHKNVNMGYNNALPLRNISLILRIIILFLFVRFTHVCMVLHSMQLFEMCQGHTRRNLQQYSIQMKPDTIDEKIRVK